MIEQLATETPPVDPAVLNAGDPPAGDVTPQPEVTPGPTETQRTVPLETFTREVTPLRAKVRDLELADQENRRKLQEANDLLARLQRNGNGADPAASPTAPPTQRPAADVSEIERAAAELNFRRDAQEIISSGLRTYGQQNWQDSVNILESFGMNNAEFVSSVMDVVGRDKAHEVVHALAQEPSMVAALRGMSPTRRGIEIAKVAEKMTAKPAAAAPGAPAKPAEPPPRQVSKAPAPAPRVDANASKVLDWNTDQDKMTDEEWSKNFNERWSKRTARR